MPRACLAKAFGLSAVEREEEKEASLSTAMSQVSRLAMPRAPLTSVSQPQNRVGGTFKTRGDTEVRPVQVEGGYASLRSQLSAFVSQKRRGPAFLSPCLSAPLYTANWLLA